MTISPRPPLRTHEQVLQALADEINVSDAAFEKARRRYLSIGEHLDREGSSLSGFSPVIHPQGSLLLGTCIKPIGDEDHYDVDLVCLLEAMKTQFTQKELKERVGQELRLYVQAHAMKHRPHRGRRCWKIEYAEGDKFHLDVLPAIPDESGYRGLMLRQGCSSVIGGKDIADLAVAITDEEHPGFDRLSADWNVSNPRGTPRGSGPSKPRRACGGATKRSAGASSPASTSFRSTAFVPLSSARSSCSSATAMRCSTAIR